MSVPVSATVFANFLALSPLTSQTGPDIGAKPPVMYGFVQNLPGDPTSVLYYIEGAAGVYGDWLSAAKLPLLACPSGYLQLDFDLVVDENAQMFAQALEFDTVFCAGGWNYLFGFQINYAQGGTIQISGADQIGWQAGMPGPGILEAHKTHHFSLRYMLNLTQHTYRFDSITIDGATYALTTNPLLTGINKNWTDHIILQVQQDTNGKAGRYSFKISNAQYSAW